MRIIGGTFGGRVLKVPKGLPARPTTDRAKEALFNILQHQLDWPDTRVLDLFTGTGNIAIECASRGAREVIAVDQDGRSIAALQQTVRDWRIKGLQPRKAAVQRFVQTDAGPFDLIFMDPPYDWEGLEACLRSLLTPDWLTIDGLLVVEHRTQRGLDHLPGHEQTRKYGDSAFSFFRFSTLPPDQ